MPSATLLSSIPVRTNSEQAPPRAQKHRPCTSYPDFLSLDEINQKLTPKASIDERPTKRPMKSPSKTIAVVNASGRQAASFIRVASAVGYNVRAQLRNLDGIVATEISSLPNVTALVGDLYTKTQNGASKSYGVNNYLISDLFCGAQLAFINTTFYGDEVAIGKALADAAKEVNIEHFIYSTMPNHSVHNPKWPSLPLWSAKHTIEQYIRALELPATFLYTGIYNNNFTSLPYPLFCMDLQSDGSFLWQAPFHPDVPLPWLDAEHDVGAAVLGLIKDGVSRWKNERIALAYEMLSPREACMIFSRGIGRPVKYRRGPIEVKVQIPTGYREQLEALEEMYALGATDPKLQPFYFGDEELEKSCPSEALDLWEGFRGLEEYAREVFPLEEAANGKTWMNEDDENGQTANDNEDDDDDDEGLTLGMTSGQATPARKDETWLA